MQGLSQAAAKKKLAKFGKNVLNIKSQNTWWKILYSQFLDLLVIILIVAAAVSFFLGEETDSCVIFFIVILNAGIGFFQEFKTERTLQALKKMIHPEIQVFRDGKEILLETELLVPGDIVILREGDKIPADGILTESNVLKIEESALTGESLPIEKKIKEKIFMGTTVAHGSGIFEVTGTGMKTKFGEIAKLTTETKKILSPLQKELNHIGVFVTKVTGIICLFLFFIGIWNGTGADLNQKIIDSLLFSVSVAIAAVPEGLPTTITIALALGASILAKKKAIIKKLSSVETLGAVTTICSDKTGTLTKNEMTVREIYLADRSIFNVTGVGYDPNLGEIYFVGGHEQTEENKKLLNDLVEICEKCNEAKLVKKDEKYQILGDPTDGALLTLVEKNKKRAKTKNLKKSSNLEQDRSALISKKFDKKNNITKIFPFDSERKMMSVISNKKILVKGSPDQVLEKCKFWTDGKKVFELNTKKRKKIQAHYERMANNALRVLACAEQNFYLKKAPDDLTEKDIEKDLIFTGLVGMIDPPREEVREAVKKCHTAGIKIIVITGDYGTTAKSIASELNIVKEKNVKVLTGVEVKKLSNTDLIKLLNKKDQSIIFARSLPEQKMRIVQLLQSKNEIVAMTGDGVNDAPALKKADIGIAMGITGTEVSKEASTMILTNDSFSSIVTAIEEGRRIYQNLKKFIWFIFSCNIGELVVVFLSILFHFPLPLTAILILAIDLGTDILPAIALGVDTAQKNLMTQKPRDTKEKVMSKKFIQDFLFVGIIIGLSVTGAFLWTLYSDFGIWPYNAADNNLIHAQTVAFVSLVFVQLINAFSARSESLSIFKQNIFENKFLLLAIFTSILMVLLMIYVPFFNQVLKTSPLDASDWLVVLIASVVPLFFIEIKKFVFLKKQKSLLR